MEYIIKSTAILSLFYVFYILFLQKDTFFQSIRLYFLIGILSALSLPLVVIPKYVPITNVVWNSTSISSSSPTLEVNSFGFSDLLFTIYLIGILFFTGRMLWQLSSLAWFLRNNKKEKIGKFNYIKTTKNITPYSFFNYIIYNEKMFGTDELTQIIIHEKTHVNQFHSFDILLSQCVTILSWFNPLAWLYHKEIQKNLEFIADEFTTQRTRTKKEYQYLLLKTTTPNHMALTTNFYNSLIKKRIDMLQKSRSQKGMQLKFALILPILIAFVFTFNTKIIAQEKEGKHFVVKKMNAEVELISKDFQKSDLENLKSRFLKHGITFKYSGLKYNTSNEIIAINLTVKNNKGTQAKLSRSGTEAIQPIKIKIDADNNSIAMGDVSSASSMGDIVFYSDKGKNKKIIEERIEGGNAIFINEDGEETIHKMEGENMVFVTKDDQGNVEKKVITINSSGNHSANVWVSKNGDSTKTKKVKVMTWSSDDDVDINATEDVNINIDEDNKTERKVIRLNSNSNSKPLIIIDGKEQ